MQLSMYGGAVVPVTYNGDGSISVGNKYVVQL
jgi:hypothetical protein